MVIERSDIHHKLYRKNEIDRMFRHSIYAQAQGKFIVIVSDYPTSYHGVCVIRETRRLQPHEQRLALLTKGKIEDSIQSTYRVELSVVNPEDIPNQGYIVYKLFER